MASRSRRALARGAYILLAVVCALSMTGARKTMRGVPLGTVLDVDTRAGSVKVDLGAKDGVLKGISFAVVDARGSQMALVTPAEVYDDMFWSAQLTAADVSRVRPGMEVRWVFTPELGMLLQARAKNTPQAYRQFAARYPDSTLLAQLAAGWPEDLLKKVDPAYYRAWKVYTARAFEDYIASSPPAPLRSVAQAELKSMKAYEAEQESLRIEREKRAAQYQEEQRRQEEVAEKVRQRQLQRDREEMHGRLVNNSSEPVRFVFDPPSMLPSTVVQPGTAYELNHPEGTYTYKVYAVPAESEFGMPEPEPVEPEPLAEGTAEIVFDFWEASYP